jgi:hypothetical protein
MRRLMVLACLGVVAAPAAAAAQSAESDVMTVITGLFDGMRTGDSAAVRAAFAPDARLMTAFERDGVPTLRAGSLEQFIALVGSPHDDIWDERIWGTDVRIDGLLATVWTNYAFYLGEKFSHCGVDAFQLFHGAAGWQIVHLIDTRRTEGCTNDG